MKYILKNQTKKVFKATRLCVTQNEEGFESYKVMCGCECCIYSTCRQMYMLLWRYRYLKILSKQSHNVRNRRYGKTTSYINQNYNNAVMTNVSHLHKTATYMTMKKISLLHLTDMIFLTVNVCFNLFPTV